MQSLNSRGPTTDAPLSPVYRLVRGNLNGRQLFLSRMVQIFETQAFRATSVSLQRSRNSGADEVCPLPP